MLKDLKGNLQRTGQDSLASRQNLAKLRISVEWLATSILKLILLEFTCEYRCPTGVLRVQQG
eukprot:11748996-Ditylum_brightwellii.AAC.1